MNPYISTMMGAFVLLLTAAILILIVFYYVRVRKGSSTSSSSSSCGVAISTGATGCLLVGKNGCETFRMTSDERGSGNSCDASVTCARGLVTLKRPAGTNELIVTAESETGTFVTDIYINAVPSCKSKCAKMDDFGQTGCTVDLGIGYTQFTFGCTGGSNIQSVTYPLPANVVDQDFAFVSVLMTFASTCDPTLVVDLLSMEGQDVPHLKRGCPKSCDPVAQCSPPVPRYQRLKMFPCCKNPI